MSLDLTRLVNLRTTPTGWVAQCPECARNKLDLNGKNHLTIFRSGAFNCVLGSKEDAAHNRNIRALVMGDGAVSSEYIDPEPRLTVEKTYPESTLLGLLPDYAYWLGRGMKESVLVALENGIAPKDTKGKLSGRSVFPCRNKEGKIVGFAGRLTEEYSFAPKWKILGKKTSFVFPPLEVSTGQIDAKSQVILVEGIGCVLALAGADIWNSLCLFGLSPSSQQICLLIARGIKQVVIATNNEASSIGNQAAEKIREKLLNFFPSDSVTIRLPSGKDFADMSEAEITKWYLSVSGGHDASN